MDNRRLILLFALAFVGLLLYQAWLHDYGPQEQVSHESTTQASIEKSTEPTIIPIPQRTVPTLDTSAKTKNGIISFGEKATLPTLIDVKTDVVHAQISTRGGTLKNLYLLKYPVTPENREIKVQLFKSQDPNLYIAQSGLIGSNKDVIPSHEAIFTSGASSYDLDSAQNSLTVKLVWTAPSGIKITKRFTFHRGSYQIDLDQIIENSSSAAQAVRSYVQLQRSKPTARKKSRSYIGAAYYSPQDKYKKLSFDDIASAPYQAEVTGGWIAMTQHYFISAWIPQPLEPKTFYTSKPSRSGAIIGMYSPSVTIAPGKSHTFSDHLFAGPKLQKQLAVIAPGLDLTVDYGWLTILAQPIFWLLDKIHSLFRNWGVAIIFLTVLIKAAFYKLSETSYKSMAGMRKLTPKLQALKDRYGDDKERLNQAMMEIYKKEKINPLGGCLPIVVQIPVFIALYWVLLESVEMRQAPFALWITNLSAPDPYFVLPLIMGISMFVQQKLNPTPIDPLQAKVMLSMPLIFTVFFAFFSSGLVLYWVVNNLLSIAQQWHITRSIEKTSS